MNQQFPKRKNPRLKGYDYSRVNAYLITICSYNKKHFFGHVIPGDMLTPSVCSLSRYGEIAKQELLNLENRFPYLTIDNFIVMPNHIHILLSLHETNEPRKDVSAIVRAYKSLTMRQCRQVGFSAPHLFQDSFNDEIIRNENHYLNSWNYVEHNAEKWVWDEYYSAP